MDPKARANFRPKLAWGLAILFTLALLAPVHLTRLVNVEASWRAVLSWAFLHNAQFGKDFIFTYGPWGFALNDNYEPGTWALQMIAKAFLVLAVALPLGVLARWGPKHAIGLAVAALLIASAQALDSVLYCLPLLFLVTGGPLLFLLAVAMALASLTKFTVLLVSPIAICAALLANRPRPIFPAITYAVALPLFWILAGQSLANVPLFIKNSLAIVSAYSEMVGLFAHSTLTVKLCYAAVALCFVVRGILLIKHNRHAALLPIAAAILLALLFNANFVRDDEPHLLVAMSTALLVSLVVTADAATGTATDAASGTLPTRTRLATSVAPVLLSILGFAFSSPIADFFPNLAGTAASRFASIAHPGGIVADHQALQRNTLSSGILPNIRGTVDLFGQRQRLLLLDGLQYTPRPVFQSYAVGTPRLAELNLHFLETSGPDHLLLQLQALDDNFPLLEDALCYREMLVRYEPAGATKTLLDLKRSDIPRTFHLEKLATRTVSLNEPLALPAEGPLWIEITYAPSLVGKVRQRLYKIPPVYVSLQTADHAERYRLNRLLTPGGFLISPLVRTPGDFAALYSDPGRLPKPTSLTLSTADPSAYDPAITIVLYRLQYPLLPSGGSAPGGPAGLNRD